MAGRVERIRENVKKEKMEVKRRGKKKKKKSETEKGKENGEIGKRRGGRKGEERLRRVKCGTEQSEGSSWKRKTCGKREKEDELEEKKRKQKEDNWRGEEARTE